MDRILPATWVERLFMRLQGVYGREFTSQFATGMVDGIDPGIENAKQVWAEELGGFCENPEAISYALKHLPDRCPNVIRFRDLCRQAPPKNAGAALVHRLSPEEIEQNQQRIKEIREMLEGKIVKGGE